MTSPQTTTIGNTAYAVEAEMTTSNVSVSYKHGAGTSVDDVKITFSNEGISIKEDVPNGKISYLITQAGDAIMYFAKGSYTTQSSLASGSNVNPLEIEHQNSSFKNLQEFKQEEPKVFSAINSALEAISRVKGNLQLSATQKVVLEKFKAQYGSMHRHQLG